VSLRVAITRALPEAEATAERVRAHGGEPVLAPLLVREPSPCAPLGPSVQALLFTSSTAPPVFATQFEAYNTLPTLCVGDATAAAARRAGFTDVRSADGDVDALASLAAAAFDPRNGPLAHISGADVAGDLAGRLQALGHTIERRIVYKAFAVSALPAAFAGPLDLVLFHSPRAAGAFLALGAPRSEALIAACLSPAIADAAAAVAWRQVIVAPAPREEALMAAIFGPAGAAAGASA
jgi:uroporphyrinogen-III synthase